MNVEFDRARVTQADTYRNRTDTWLHVANSRGVCLSLAACGVVAGVSSLIVRFDGIRLSRHGSHLDRPQGQSLCYMLMFPAKNGAI